MDIEQISQRVEKLTTERDVAFQQLAALDNQQKQLFANINAFNGALEESNYWLAQLQGTTPTPVTLPQVPDSSASITIEGTIEGAQG